MISASIYIREHEGRRYVLLVRSGRCVRASLSKPHQDYKCKWTLLRSYVSYAAERRLPINELLARRQ